MIAALMIFGLIATIALLVPVSFKITSFICGYKNSKKETMTQIMPLLIIQH